MSRVYSIVGECRLHGHVHCPDESCMCPCHDSPEDREEQAQAMAQCRVRCTGEPYEQALEVMHRSLARDLAWAWRPW